jgi:hypothetical protein
MSHARVLWGAKWHDRNSEHLLNENCIPVIFRTRAESRVWIKDNYGYIRTREDLRTAPHWWRVPIAVRVQIKEIK